MNRTRRLPVCAGVILLSLCICTREKKDTDIPVAVVDGDTLSYPDIVEILPRTPAGDSYRTLGAIRIRIFGNDSSAIGDSALHESIAGKLARDLNNQGGTPWSRASASRLLAASIALKKRAQELGYGDTLLGHVDSTVLRRAEFLVQSPPPSVSKPPSDSSDGTTNAFGRVLGLAFFISDRDAESLSRYTSEKERVFEEIAETAKTMKGLVQEGKQRPTPQRSPRRVKLNSREALRHRPQSSIQRTIQTHSPNIKALYKRLLKTEQRASGRVMVRFLVAPSGKVVSARVQSSDIRDQHFLEALTSYLSGIEFRSIPSNVGNMSFVFPFDFTAE